MSHPSDAQIVAHVEEVARWRARAERAEAAIGRVLKVCESVQSVRVADVRRAIGAGQ